MCHVNQRTSNKLVGNVPEQTTKIFFPVIHKRPAPTGTSHFMSSQTSVFKRRHAAFWWLSYLNFQTPREYKTLILVWLFFHGTESQDSEFWRDRYVQSGLTQWNVADSHLTGRKCMSSFQSALSSPPSDASSASGEPVDDQATAWFAVRMGPTADVRGSQRGASRTKGSSCLFGTLALSH